MFYIGEICYENRLKHLKRVCNSTLWALRHLNQYTTVSIAYVLSIILQNKIKYCLSDLPRYFTLALEITHVMGTWPRNVHFNQVILQSFNDCKIPYFHLRILNVFFINYMISVSNVKWFWVNDTSLKVVRIC